MGDERITDIIIELDKEHLALLKWLGEWTPEVHRANWKLCRAWPPGYRNIRDMSADHLNSSKMAEARKTMSLSPEPRHDKGRAHLLLAYRLVEGSAYTGVVRLTRRGRAMLKYHGLDAPDSFKSHAPDIFDDIPLLPVVEAGVFEMCSREAREHGNYGTDLPDTKETWHKMIVEYREDDYRSKGTLTGASAHLGSISTTGTYLNGSLREHHRYLSLSIDSSTKRRICEIAFSLEGLADLLTSGSNVPVTIEHYFDHEGMMQSEPVPPPVRPMDRMKARLESGTDEQSARLNDMAEKIKAAKNKIGVRLSDELLFDIRIALENGPSNHAFAVKQAVEEMSAAVESMMTIASEKAVGGGGLKAVEGTVTKLLNTPKKLECQHCGVAILKGDPFYGDPSGPVSCSGCAPKDMKQ